MKFSANRSQVRLNPIIDGDASNVETRHSLMAGYRTEGASRFEPQVMRSLRARPLLAGAVAAGVTLLLVLAALLQPRRFEAVSIVGFASALSAPVTDPSREEKHLKQQSERIAGAQVTAAAVASLADADAGEWRLPDEIQTTTLTRLRKSIEVERIPGRAELVVRLSAATPNAAKDLLNAVIRAYLLSAGPGQMPPPGWGELLAGQRNWLREQLETERAEKSRLSADAASWGARSFDGAENDLHAAELQVQLASARRSHDALIGEVEGAIAGGGHQGQELPQAPENTTKTSIVVAAEEAVETKPGLGGVKVSITARRARLQSAMAGLPHADPRYKADQDELADLKRTSWSGPDGARSDPAREPGSLRGKLEQAAQVERRFNLEVAEWTSGSASRVLHRQRAEDLAVDQERLRVRSGQVERLLAGLARDGEAVAPHLLIPASLSDNGGPSARGLLLSAASPVGLLFGLGAAIFARIRDRRIFRAEDVKKATGLEPFAVLPSLADVSAAAFDGYVIRLARSLDPGSREQSGIALLITGASPSTHTLHLLQMLGVKLAEQGRRVELVAALDLIPGSREGTGGRLALQPAASAVEEEEEESELSQFRREADVVLIDAAPLLSSAESEFAARSADVILLVAGSGETTAEDLRASLEDLQRLDARDVRLVLQDVRLATADDAFRQAARGMERRTLQLAHDFTEEIGERKEPATVQTRQPDDPDRPPTLSTHEATPARLVWSALPEIVTSLSAFQGEVRASIFSAEEVGPSEQRGDLAPEDDLAPETISLLAPWKKAAITQTKAQPPYDVDFLDSHQIVSLEDSREVLFASEKEDVIVTKLGLFERSTGSDPVLASTAPSLRQAMGDESATGPEASSKVNLVSQEKELSSKATWFSRLFRGDSPAAFRVVPEEEEEEHWQEQEHQQAEQGRQDESSSQRWEHYQAPQVRENEFYPRVSGDSREKDAAFVKQVPFEQVLRPRVQRIIPALEVVTQPAVLAQAVTGMPGSVVSSGVEPVQYRFAQRTVIPAMVPPVDAHPAYLLERRAALTPEPTPSLFVAHLPLAEANLVPPESGPGLLVSQAREFRDADLLEWPARPALDPVGAPRVRPQFDAERPALDGAAQGFEVKEQPGRYGIAGRDVPPEFVRESELRRARQSLQAADSRFFSSPVEDASGQMEQPASVELGDPQSSRFRPRSGLRAANVQPRMPQKEAEDRFSDAFRSDPIRPRQDRSRTELPPRDGEDSGMSRNADGFVVRSGVFAARTSEPVQLVPESQMQALTQNRASGLSRRWGLLSRYQEGTGTDEDAGVAGVVHEAK